MESSFFHWKLNLDPCRIRRYYESAPSQVDVYCCTACAAFLVAVAEKLFPPNFVRLLDEAGVDLRQPADICGAPEAGTLEAWFVAAGELDPAVWGGEAAQGFIELEPGFRCWLTSQLSTSPRTALDEPRFQIEFQWQRDPFKGYDGSTE
jgi:hypothetical protein